MLREAAARHERIQRGKRRMLSRLRAASTSSANVAARCTRLRLTVLYAWSGPPAVCVCSIGTSIHAEAKNTMNRIARILCSASLFGAVTVAPSLAHAQAINVAPPAYFAPVLQRRDHDGYARDADRDDRYAWERDRGHDQWARERREHERTCIRAFEEGAPHWVLERMHCETY